MKSKIITITIIILLTIEVLLSINSAIILKSLFKIQDIEQTITIVRKVMLFSNLLFSVIVIVVLSIIIQSLLTTNRDNKKLSSEVIERIIKNESKETTSEEQTFTNVTIQKLNKGIENYKNITEFLNKVLSNIAGEYQIMQAIFFIKLPNETTYKKTGSYAFYSEKKVKEFTENEGLAGQVAANKKLLNVNNIPDNYIKVVSGLGKSTPNNLLILPVVANDKSIGVVELASFHTFDKAAEEALTQFLAQIADKLQNEYFSEVVEAS